MTAYTYDPNAWVVDPKADMEALRAALEPPAAQLTREHFASYTDAEFEAFAAENDSAFRTPAKTTEVTVTSILSFGTTHNLARWLDRLAAAGIRLYAKDFARGEVPLNGHKGLIDLLADMDISALRKAQAAALAQAEATAALAGAFRKKFSKWTEEFMRRHSLAERLAAGIADDSAGASKIGEDLRAWREAAGLSRAAVAEKLGVTESALLRFEAGSRSEKITPEMALDLMYPAEPAGAETA
jgi:DNA-binding XRE family transcriptional regulator